MTQDNPEETKSEKCRYNTCLEILDDIKINDEHIKMGKTSGGKYAVCTIDHKVEAVQRAWNEIFSVLFNRGYQIDISRPIIERYAYKMLKNHKCEICVPIN
ncbi:GyrI-like domain-containing protein [Clostridium mucosae]|uniref:GyrI-like domain-containing protein n=1 Tax=Clostridium sp. DSM 100503 TaxID=2963282 RepID=UPI0027E4A55A|nr:GyrI-like domain-containing protein [Clostridium sp. DSM 100503]